MQFDPDNHIIRLCAKGMEMEGSDSSEAKRLFLQAWAESENDFEKFTSAHYVARHQATVAEKLHWDEIALAHAQAVDDESMQAYYPSLYLNVGKCYEDLGDNEMAKNRYEKALSYAHLLPTDGYGTMIISGIKNGIKRVS